MLLDKYHQLLIVQAEHIFTENDIMREINYSGKNSNEKKWSTMWMPVSVFKESLHQQQITTIHRKPETSTSLKIAANTFKW